MNKSELCDLSDELTEALANIKNQINKVSANK